MIQRAGGDFMKALYILMAVSLGVLVSACQTPKKKPEAPSPPRTDVRFKPAWAVSPIRTGEGRHPDLFGGDSKGVWVSPEVAAMKKSAASPAGSLAMPLIDEDAHALSQAYIVIECHLESEFADMSIAQDAVQLRGIQLHLESPDGLRVPPLQTLSFGSVQEEEVGALKRFRLTTVAIFPRDNLLVAVPSLIATAPQVRLVLEGHDSTFYFEWAAMPSGETGMRAPTPEEALCITKLGYYELYGSIRRLAHVLD